jgi:CRISPR-associated endonuclease Csn1
MRTLGLDLGTNSIGWALIDTNGGRTELVDKGVHVFEKGVDEIKGIECSRAAQRTLYRAARRQKMRRTWRKQNTLRVLVEHGYCPAITTDDIQRWRKDKQFPSAPQFREWLNTKESTSDGKPAGPYYYRWLGATQSLDLKEAENRDRLGRAFYHLAQRRGYRSNRVSGEERDGVVAGAIEALDAKRGDRTLGQYYYEELLGKEPVRGGAHYTSRKQYEEEFETICEKQGLPADLVAALRHAIFMQRPLRSQKGTVGKCPLEPTKARCPLSHPLFERFRALQLINNIRVQSPEDAEARPLSEAERKQALAWMLTLKKSATFAKLAKQLTPKRAHIEYGKRDGSSAAVQGWHFNYREDSDVPACPVNARFNALWGADWEQQLAACYKKAAGKTNAQIVDDIWHVLFSFTDTEHLIDFGKRQLELTDEDAKRFAQPVPSGYANLSLAALRRIVPFMENGLMYSHAVFMAALPDAFKAHGQDWASHADAVQQDIATLLEEHRVDTGCQRAISHMLTKLQADDMDPRDQRAAEASWNQLKERMYAEASLSVGTQAWSALTEEERERRIDACLEALCKHYAASTHPQVETIEQRIRALLADRYNLPASENLKLYHPSAIDPYPAPTRKEDGTTKLGDPRIPSIKNPVFLRTMVRLRHLINALLREGLIDADTRIRIEMTRELNNQNERNAVYREQRTRQKEHADYASKIEAEGYPASDRNILKYRLWLEQERQCLYTGAIIGLSEFLGENPVYDIEHTLPRSRTLNNSQSNLTLCERQYNREVKRNAIPAELPDAEMIRERARKLWQPKIEELEALVEKRVKKSRQASDKEAKDEARSGLLYYRNQLRYWRAKLAGFERENIPEGFSNSQLGDTRMICKYALLYVKTAFPYSYSVKSEVVHGAKAIWGVAEKFRGSHAHHCVDAIVTACLRPRFYNALASYYHEYERYERTEAKKPEPPEPWEGFAWYLNESLPKEILCVHHDRSNLLKPTFRRLRQRGRIVRDEKDNPIMVRSQSARGTLHKESIYGLIQKPGTSSQSGEPELVTVERKRLDKNFKDIEQIIDGAVRQRVMDQQDRLEAGETVWFDEKRGIPIKTVRVKVQRKQDSLVKVGKHLEVSKHAYKHHKLAAIDGNYITAIYRGTLNGKPKGDKKVISNTEAVDATRNGRWEEIMPDVDDRGLTLRHVLKSGTLLLFYKDTPDELREISAREISRRLYKVTGMEQDALNCTHHLCALREKETGRGYSRVEWDGEPSPRLRISVNSISILVNGKDFRLDPLGRIKWLETADA